MSNPPPAPAIPPITVSIAESSFNYYPWALYESGGVASMDASIVKAAATNIVPSEQEVSASVTATYKLI